LFWNLGKIHGLENIIYLDDETLNKCDNPWDLQIAINEVNDKPKPLPE